MESLNSNYKTIKEISTKRFELVLTELTSGSYCVVSEVNGRVRFSDIIKDLNFASYVFDQKLVELQGN